MNNIIGETLFLGKSKPNNQVRDQSFAVGQALDGSAYLMEMTFWLVSGDTVVVEIPWTSPLGELLRGPEFGILWNDLRSKFDPDNL